MIRFDRLVGRVLRSAGIDAVYGLPFGELPVVPVRSPEVSRLLALAHQRVHGTAAAVSAGDGVLCLPGPPPPWPSEVSTATTPSAEGSRDVGSSADLLSTVGGAAAGESGAPRRLRLTVAPAEPVADVVPDALPVPSRWDGPDDAIVDRVRAASAVAVLVGPGLVHAGTAAELHELAAVGGLSVVNTWGAKGVFDWRSRHHGATVGLQADDFTLAGLDRADLIVVSGVDPREAPPERWQLAPWIAVAPSALGPLAERWPVPAAVPAVPPLRARLAAVTQRGWQSDGAPLPPSRVTLHYGQCLNPDGMVAADPGVAGFWVARTFATTEVGRVHVPAESDRHGFAAACALAARLRRPARPVLAVVDAPVRDEVTLVLEAAARLGVAVPLEVWDGDGDRLDASGHRERLGRAVAGEESTVLRLATDTGQMDEMVAAAGPVVAWTT